MNVLSLTIWNELIDACAAHLVLVVEAVALAALIAVPVGIAANRVRSVERLALTAANALQTIPSLALLGILLILFHGAIGKPPALAALVVYSVLPILKNTILGLRGVDPAVIDAAKGMGLTSMQRLMLVELPLAVPSILSGVRLATVASVGMAAIAALIGARGLGQYIYRGVSLSDTRLILLGAIPSALLALACDASLGEIERKLDPRRDERPGWTHRGALGLVVLLAALTAWGWFLEFRSGARSEVIRIGSKDSAEPILLGHMLAELVEAHTGLPVDRRLNLGGTLVCYNALREGGLDVYVEYTGTALTTILKQPPTYDPEQARRLVAEGVLKDGVRMLEPIGFENSFAILMRREQAASLGIHSISDLARHASITRAGFGPEFMNRPDGYPGLVKAYGLAFAETPRELDRNLLYEAVRRGTLDVAAGDSTDGRVQSLDLVVLDDDRRYFPPYEAVPLARAATLDRYPALAVALDQLAGQIDADTMRALNAQVDGLKRDPYAVAIEFLRSRGLLDPRGVAR